MKEKSRLIIVIFAAIALLAIVGVIVYSSESSARSLKTKIELGQQYLTELKYEEAVAVFSEALAIAPKNKEAISGFTEANKGLSDSLIASSDFKSAVLALDEARTVLPGNSELIEIECDIYLQWADFVMEDENYADAIKLLIEGYDKLGDERLKQRADELQAEYEKYQSKHNSIKVKARIEKTDLKGIIERNKTLIEDGAHCEGATYYMVFLEPVDFYIQYETNGDVTDDVITLSAASFLISRIKEDNNQPVFSTEEHVGEDVELYVYPYVSKFTKKMDAISDEVYILEYDENGNPKYYLRQVPDPYYVYLDQDMTDELFGDH